jgi:hypothetical protein
MVDFKKPSSLLSIGDRAFYKCTSLVSIDIPLLVTSIGDGAFDSCTSLVSAYIPSSVTYIEDYAFAHCTSLINVSIPPDCECNPPKAFVNCDKLQAAIDSDNNNEYEPRANVIEWLKCRFDKLPFHQVCYNPDITITLLHNTIQYSTKEALLATDNMGMNALHILVCNPAITADLIEMVVALDPRMSMMENMHGTTPIDLFLQLQGIDLDDGAVFSLEYAIKKGMSWNVIQKMKALDRNFILDADEYTFLKAAASKKCNLEVLYNLFMIRGIESIPIVLARGGRSGKKRSIDQV